MSQKTQWIILGILAAVLATVAAYELWPKGAASDNPAPGSAGSQASATATTEAPSVEELENLKAWFDFRKDIAPEQTGPAFGLEQRASAPASVPHPQQPPPTVSFRETPKLEGIIGDTAIYMGEAYKVGEKVRGTGFKVTEVGKGFVRIESDDGRKVQQFWQD